MILDLDSWKTFYNNKKEMQILDLDSWKTFIRYSQPKYWKIWEQNRPRSHLTLLTITAYFSQIIWHFDNRKCIKIRYFDRLKFREMIQQNIITQI